MKIGRIPAWTIFAAVTLVWIAMTAVDAIAGRHHMALLESIAVIVNGYAAYLIKQSD